MCVYPLEPWVVCVCVRVLGHTLSHESPAARRAGRSYSCPFSGPATSAAHTVWMLYLFFRAATRAMRGLVWEGASKTGRSRSPPNRCRWSAGHHGSRTYGHEGIVGSGMRGGIKDRMFSASPFFLDHCFVALWLCDLFALQVAMSTTLHFAVTPGTCGRPTTQLVCCLSSQLHAALGRCRSARIASRVAHCCVLVEPTAVPSFG
jgi:hypothetical protein